MSSSSSFSSQEEEKVQWIPAHCMIYRKDPTINENLDCPIGYVKREGHYRRMPSVESTHIFMNRFFKKMRHKVARHPHQCPRFQDLEEFHDCMRMVQHSLQSYLLKNPTMSQVKKYVDHLVTRVFYCTGRKLQNECHFKPTTRARRYIERSVQQYVDEYQV